MKWLTGSVVVAAALLLGACKTMTAGEEIPMYPAVVGEKTDLYEVTSESSLRLAPGVRVEVVEGPGGGKCGMVLMRQNNTVGGYMSCGCMGATQGNCVTTNDNPEHPSCSGGCTDSEGNPRGCSLYGPLIGPPKDPAMVRFRERPVRR